LIKFLKKLERNKILLMHGGCERVMEFAELIRFNQNIFLDLSLTLMKYQGSSVDNDLKFLFNNFDRKITLGSDYPEVNYPLFLKRIKFFSKNVAINKLKNIYFKNAQSIFI
jgi:predicted TIM-barrel fold metal-dependent hydrolase